MAKYVLSRLAAAGLIAIADYTTDAWGAEQALRYFDGLRECIEQLARTPGMGRSCDRVRTGYRRFEHGKHVIFFRVDGGDIFVSRILHQRMLPNQRLIDSE